MVTFSELHTEFDLYINGVQENALYGNCLGKCTKL